MKFRRILLIYMVGLLVVIYVLPPSEDSFTMVYHEVMRVKTPQDIKHIQANSTDGIWAQYHFSSYRPKYSIYSANLTLPFQFTNFKTRLNCQLVHIPHTKLAIS